MPDPTPANPVARLRAAMRVANATHANYAEAVSTIYGLAVILRDEGVDQISLYKAFSEVLRSVDPDDLLYDALTETMDEIWGGGWAKRGGLYPEQLSDARLCDFDHGI